MFFWRRWRLWLSLLIFSAFPVKGNFKSLVVLSSSMEPKVKMGSVVAVRPAAEYKVGDIITFGEMSRTEEPDDSQNSRNKKRKRAENICHERRRQRTRRTKKPCGKTKFWEKFCFRCRMSDTRSPKPKRRSDFFSL